MKEKDKKNEEKHAINKGGFYANLHGSTKGFTIFIIICSIVFVLFILLLVI
ncbi:hypothetical protein [Haploplasma modicum]|uniref:hypothetical protein n=1 Tax=Haploplasma modicum TaxID=2150 RepID=UPI00214B404E|nr:hypothetical protein [Haploplasma modicum]MCR1809072.1 hypothetical protein [Haploplasma modicum]